MSAGCPWAYIQAVSFPGKQVRNNPLYLVKKTGRLLSLATLIPACLSASLSTVVSSQLLVPNATDTTDKAATDITVAKANVVVVCPRMVSMPMSLLFEPKPKGPLFVSEVTFQQYKYPYHSMLRSCPYISIVSETMCPWRTAIRKENLLVTTFTGGYLFLALAIMFWKVFILQ